MIQHNAQSRRAMEILIEKLAHASVTENYDTFVPTPSLRSNQHISQYPTIPSMASNAHAAQAPAADNDTARENSSDCSQLVLHDASSSALAVSNSVGETSSAFQQQQNGYIGNMPSGPNGEVGFVLPAPIGNHVARDVFSNDHLTSEMVPIEDPAEAFALSQSTVPIEIRQQRTRQLNLLTCGPNQCPTAAVALHPDNFPFVEGALLAQPTPAYGVIKLNNVSDRVSRSEILAVMGRNSHVLNDNQEPVHIIIERVNGATRDAYVEFLDEMAAQDTIARFQDDKMSGKGPRLANQPLHFELSSQAVMMKALFPQARGVEWIGAVPRIVATDPSRHYSWELYKGFISVEEMTVLARHAESNKSWHSPQRPYESMISTMRKMPWYMTEHITILQRQSMYEAVLRMIKALQRKIQFGNKALFLTEQLLDRLCVSAMLCHGFTVTQKDNIAYTARFSAERMRDFNMPRAADKWLHTHSLVPKPNVAIDVLEWYIAIIREMTNDEISRFPPNELREIRRQVQGQAHYWGYYWRVLGLTEHRGSAVDNMSLADMAGREFYAITCIVNHAFGAEVTQQYQYQYHPYQQQHQGVVNPGQQANVNQQQLIVPGHLQPIGAGQQAATGHHQQVDQGQLSGLGGQ